MTPTQRKALEQALECLHDNRHYLIDRERREYLALYDKAIDDAEAALAEQEPRNQCGETCERAKLCAVCAGGLAEQEPVEQAKPSPTSGMNIAQRILHVGGRNNAAGYVEFGSIQAVEALVRQFIRDLPQPAKPAEQEPVKFLANGTRFKMSFFQNEDGEGNTVPGTHVTCFEAFEEELDGRWVALVPAEDDCHLKYTAPQPKAEQQEPVAWAKDTGKKLRITHMDMRGEDGWRPLGYIDAAPQPKAEQEPDEVKQIAEALRQVGLTLIRTGTGFRVADLGRVEAQTTPQPRKRLTDEEIAELMMTHWGCASIAPRNAPAFARAIEAAVWGDGK